jgi:transcriptional regulator with XRE-family HTH domain
MIPEQCRGARAMLNMSREELAQLANVAERTIADFEAGRRQPIPSTLSALQRALYQAGIEFIGSQDDNPGISIRTPRAPVEP